MHHTDGQRAYVIGAVGSCVVDAGVLQQMAGGVDSVLVGHEAAKLFPLGVHGIVGGCTFFRSHAISMENSFSAR